MKLSVPSEVSHPQSMPKLPDLCARPTMPHIQVLAIRAIGEGAVEEIVQEYDEVQPKELHQPS
jgi:hypothetical protein